MNSAQRKAVHLHRDRQKQRGVVRVEVQAPASDAALLRELAAALRSDGTRARKVRARVREALQPPKKQSIRELLACDLPDEVVEEALERPLDFGRDVDL